MEIEWGRLSAEALRRQAELGALVILPVASTEQHGPHLATFVDTILSGEVAKRAARLMIAHKHPVVVAPTVWCGLAEHHMPFGGTFTLSFATYRALLRDLCSSILRDGFRRVLMLNGHGGNIAGLNVIVGELTQELNAPIAATTYWTHAEDAYKDILEDQLSVHHACEAETSAMMAVAPELVDVARLPQAVGPVPTKPGSVLNQPLNRWRSFQEITASGVVGDARKASKEKGERLLDAAAKALAERLLAGEPWT
jgi:creatinine amidohydrolase